MNISENPETLSTDIMVQRDLGSSVMLENESGANEAVNQHCPHDLQAPPGICNTLSLDASSFAMQQPLHVPYTTPLVGVVSNTPTMVEGGTIQGVVVPTEETLPVTSPPQLHGRMDSTCAREVGTTPVPTQNAGMTSVTRSIVTTIPSVSLSSSATTHLPPTEGSSGGSDHGILHSDSQQGTTQELNPCAGYVDPGKGPLSGGVQATIVGTNFPHTLPLNVYFGTNLALVVSWKHQVRG